ncbi:hypothetical protein CM49_06187 [Paenibacillus sp. P1XP2]|nr:hypothetical protein CM49_06187 [Paenibacillus sp. P1XP2]
MKKRWLDRLFGGVVLIGIGVIFLLNQLNVIDISLGYVFKHYWPVILIVLGVKELLKGRRAFAGAAILLLFGTYFLGRNEGWDWVTPGSFFKIIIPSLLILAACTSSSNRMTASRRPGRIRRLSRLRLRPTRPNRRI